MPYRLYKIKEITNAADDLINAFNCGPARTTRVNMPNNAFNNTRILIRRWINEHEINK
jgi:hypothetical protein